MLDLTKLRQRCSQGEHFRYLFFWGQPALQGWNDYSIVHEPVVRRII